MVHVEMLKDPCMAHGSHSGDGRAAVRIWSARRAEDPMLRRSVPADGQRSVRG
jgi:hypothetical protein